MFQLPKKIVDLMNKDLKITRNVLVNMLESSELFIDMTKDEEAKEFARKKIEALKSVIQTVDELIREEQ